MRNIRKKIAGLLCVITLLLPLFSTIFISTHRKHECSGRECTVCSELTIAEQILAITKLALTVVILFGSVFYLERFRALMKYHVRLIHKTLISLKVELLE